MEDTQSFSTETHSTTHASSGMEALKNNSVTGRESAETTASTPDTIAPKGYLPFVEARKFAESLNLKTRKEWRTYVKGELANTPPKPANVPSHPDGIYKVKGWQGWKHWLGTVEVGVNTVQH